MSDLLYPTRLRWAHGIGCARHDGVQVDLHHPPLIAGLDGLTELDFVPHVIAVARLRSECMRDMSNDQQHDALALLQAMAAAARSVTEGA